MTKLTELGLTATVSAVVQEASMSEDVQVEAAESADAAADDAPAVGPEDAAAVALVADDPADEVEVEVEEQALNADGAAAVAGELFGGPDANQAVHSVESEGFTVEDEGGEDEVEEV